MRGKVFIDGRIVDPESAQISVFDRGFLYGDSVYETMRVYRGVPFAFDEHVERLFSSGDRIGFALPWSIQQLRAACKETLADAELDDAYMRIIGTRGSGAIGLDPALATDPRLIIMVLELPMIPAAAYERGRSAWLVSVQRNIKQALDPQAKTGNYMNSILAAGEARARGADEAIMLDFQGRVAEGSSANVFALIEGVWRTPPADGRILSGITRATLLAVCAREGIAVSERVLMPEDLQRATEMFISSSVREIIPIVLLNGRPIGDGVPGAQTRRVHAAYKREVEARTESF